MNDDLKKRLNLKDGETLEHESHKMKGPLQETDIYTYAVLNAAGEKVGSVVHTDHTSIKGFKRTQTIEQYDITRKVISDVSW
jgi:hypothetical protein